jgi:hypothetical protein
VWSFLWFFNFLSPVFHSFLFYMLHASCTHAISFCWLTCKVALERMLICREEVKKNTKGLTN